LLVGGLRRHRSGSACPAPACFARGNLLVGKPLHPGVGGLKPRRKTSGLAWGRRWPLAVGAPALPRPLPWGPTSDPVAIPARLGTCWIASFPSAGRPGDWPPFRSPAAAPVLAGAWKGRTGTGGPEWGPYGSLLGQRPGLLGLSFWFARQGGSHRASTGPHPFLGTPVVFALLLRGMACG